MMQAETMSQDISDDALASLWLKRRVEGMSELAIMWSRNAYTSRRTVHVAFCNGVIKTQGEPAPRQDADILDLAEDTLMAIRLFRKEIAGPAGLVWRCEPEVTRENGAVQIYTRLCFEPEVVG